MSADLDAGAVAVVAVRDGHLPLGADESVAEAGGVALVVGSGTREAAATLVAATHVRCAELGPYAPGAWAAALAPALRGTAVVVLAASPDGRDLAPRLADALERPLWAPAVEVRADHVVVLRRGGLVAEAVRPAGPFVATLLPGVRGVEAPTGPTGATVDVADLDLPPGAGGHPGGDVEVLEVQPPDPATVDLSEATRIVAGGAGLGGPEAFSLLARVAPAMGASFGATRVASDVGWAPHDRYIGTTGVTVHPRVYVALGISGAVQHVTGLGDPAHVVAVNTDPSAPMMAMADLAIVTDARALLVELAGACLEVTP